MKKSKVVRPIDLEEFALINGIPQYLYHRGASAENPVLLYLHGGPGSVESNLAHVYQEKIEERFTVVHWDQRGAGKTLLKNPGSLPDIDILLQDLSELIQYLKKKYHKEKIVLTGHSWGSIFGSYYVLEHPEDNLILYRYRAGNLSAGK